MSYIVFIDTIEVDGTKFWEGFSVVIDDSTDTDGHYIDIEYEDEIYSIPIYSVMITDRPSRNINVSYDEYISIRHNDKTTHYVDAVKKHLRIDMRKNYKAQFRDGVNPLKDGTKKKEEPYL